MDVPVSASQHFTPIYVAIQPLGILFPPEKQLRAVGSMAAFILLTGLETVLFAQVPLSTVPEWSKAEG